MADEQWHDLYSEAIAVGQSYADALHIREKELLDLKGPCPNAGCRLHHDHYGPCNPERFGVPHDARPLSVGEVFPGKKHNVFDKDKDS